MRSCGGRASVDRGMHGLSIELRNIPSPEVLTAFPEQEGNTVHIDVVESGVGSQCAVDGGGREHGGYGI